VTIANFNLNAWEKQNNAPDCEKSRVREANEIEKETYLKIKSDNES